jgi:hypothetical protein
MQKDGKVTLLGNRHPTAIDVCFPLFAVESEGIGV